MSVRLLTKRLVKHGRFILQTYWKRDIHTNILEQNQTRNTRQQRLPTAVSAAGKKWGPKNALNALGSASGSSAATGQLAANVPRSAGIFRFGQHARKLFIDNVLNRVTTTYSAELRNQAKKKLFYGDSAPFFALIGVSLASGAGVLTKEDELEGVCWEIREAASRLQNSWNYDEISETLDSSFSINKLAIGPAIAKGCAAVVYAASLKNQSECSDTSMQTLNDSSTSSVLDVSPSNERKQTLQQQSFRPELMSPLQNMSRFVHNFGGSLDNLQMFSQTSAATQFEQALKAKDRKEEVDEKVNIKLSSNSNNTFSGVSSGVAGLQTLDTNVDVSIRRYPLALKMMFNYDIQSSAMAILRAMYKETVPARQRYINEAAESWEQHIQDQTLILPPHPNIVCMYGFFCDEVGNFPDGHLLYPIAQPQRINPNGYGRNMSLYLLMKRYDFSLRAFLDTHQLTTRSKLLLLTQLLEAVAHISRHGIAHRDLKSDNILIELNDDDSPPILVLSDFGCCLADKVHGLRVPYTSFDIDKGGNAALMAPEIINKMPGPFAVLNYSKADLWACGAIAYEIFGMRNPFYSSSGGLNAAKGEQTFSLRNSNYKEKDLPALSEECPAVVQQLIYNILSPNPSKRVSPDIAANIMQLFLWAPSQWLKLGGIPNSPEILQWLLSLTTKLMCESKLAGGNDALSTSAFNYQQSGRRTYVEYLLISSFLARTRLRRIRGALNWIQNVI